MLKQTVEIIKKAEQIFLSDNFKISEKDSASNIVTTNDTAIQDFLCSEMKKSFGDIGFICEENDCRTDAPKHEYIAVIDPIDGTANYARGLAECGISVAVYKNGSPYFGIVSLPRLNELYTAKKDGGAFLNGRPIYVSNHDFAHSCFFTSYCAYRKTLSKPCFEISQELFPNIDDLRRLGSAAAELCFIAGGKGELFFEARLFPWDFAAAAIILKEAGGFCCETDYDAICKSMPQPFYAANSRKNFEKLQGIVLKHLNTTVYENAIYKNPL